MTKQPLYAEDGTVVAEVEAGIHPQYRDTLSLWNDDAIEPPRHFWFTGQRWEEGRPPPLPEQPEWDDEG